MIDQVHCYDIDGVYLDTVALRPTFDADAAPWAKLFCKRYGAGWPCDYELLYDPDLSGIWVIYTRPKPIAQLSLRVGYVIEVERAA